jgi:hypothetical protein
VCRYVLYLKPRYGNNTKRKGQGDTQETKPNADTGGGTRDIVGPGMEQGYDEGVGSE